MKKDCNDNDYSSAAAVAHGDHRDALHADGTPCERQVQCYGLQPSGSREQLHIYKYAATEERC